MLVGTFPEANASFPPHRHVGCLEYFIVIKGKMVLDFGNGVRRVMKPKSCAAVDEGATHSLKCLEAGTEYIVVSIPMDHHISSLLDRVAIARQEDKDE